MRDYLREQYLERYQQIHAHMMSINARALVGLLFTPGLLDEEVKQIIHGRENAGRGPVWVEDGAVKKEVEKASGGE